MPIRFRVTSRDVAPALLVGCLLGCSSGTPPGTTGNSTDVLAAPLASAFCAQAAVCCPTAAAPADAAADGGVDAGGTGICGASAIDGTSCTTRATLSAQQQLALVATALDEGLLTINQAVLTACVAAYQNLGCAAVAPGLNGPDVQAVIDDPACANLFVGYVPVNERCDMSAECSSGSFCRAQGTGQNATSIAGNGTLGVCFPYQQAGQPCNTSADCMPTLGCDPTTFTCQP